MSERDERRPMRCRWYDINTGYCRLRPERMEYGLWWHRCVLEGDDNGRCRNYAPRIRKLKL